MGFRRRATIYVVMGTLLLCPYSCLGRITAVAETANVAHDCRGDDCCGPLPGSESGGNRPNPSDSGSQCGTCLCHGAVLQSPTIPPAYDNELTAILPVDVLLALTNSSILADSLFAVEHTVCHFPAADSGREVRALIESLLL